MIKKKIFAHIPFPSLNLTQKNVSWAYYSKTNFCQHDFLPFGSEILLDFCPFFIIISCTRVTILFLFSTWALGC